MRDQSVFYVYTLKDPRSDPARPFYIGKGAGTRAWEHELRVDQSAKGERIRAIQVSGHEVLTVMLVEGLSEVEALRTEAELIPAFGTQDRGRLLTNVVAPTGTRPSKNRGVIVPAGAVEKAHVALEPRKSAVFESIRANQDGMTHYDVAQCPRLQSECGGGSKNHLSHSVLGIVMREGKVEAIPNQNHVALVK